VRGVDCGYGRRHEHLEKGSFGEDAGDNSGDERAWVDSGEPNAVEGVDVWLWHFRYGEFWLRRRELETMTRGSITDVNVVFLIQPSEGISGVSSRPAYDVVLTSTLGLRTNYSRHVYRNGGIINT